MIADQRVQAAVGPMVVSRHVTLRILYRSSSRAKDGAPPALTSAAQQSVAAGLRAAGHLPGGLRDGAAEAVRQAFINGLHTGSLAAAGATAAAALVTLAFLPARVRPARPVAAGAGQPGKCWCPPRARPPTARWPGNPPGVEIRAARPAARWPGGCVQNRPGPRGALPGLAKQGGPAGSQPTATEPLQDPGPAHPHTNGQWR